MISLVSVQPLDWKTVKRNVALAEKTWAVVINELVESIVAVPDTTLQVVKAIGFVPAVAPPCSEKAVEGPSLHRRLIRSGVSSGPIWKGYWIGSIRSSIVAVSDGKPWF